MPERTASVGVLFTDVVGSTRRWEQDPDSMGPLMARHDRALAEAVETADGRVIKGTGDGILAVFPTAARALDAAVAAQHVLHAEPPNGLGLGVRMAVHSGPVIERDGDVFGPTVIRCSRLMDTGHGGQILVSDEAAVMTDSVKFVDLGVHHLRDLAEPIRVHQAIVAGLPGEFPALRTLKAFAHNLPTRQTSFVGREMELRDIPALLSDRRLVTLCGPGGSGKTRLALQVAADVLDRYGDGVWFIDLLAAAPDADPADAVAAELGLQNAARGDSVGALVEAFARTSTLLVVDNCEHLLDRAGRMIRSLLGGTRDLRVLATSREPLHLEGESVVLVDPLPVPGLGGADETYQVDSVRLFENRAAEAGFAGDESERADLIAAICRRLDGMPLAIELAAARLRYVSLQELDRSLAIGFEPLRTSHAEDPRHATIRTTVAWSYDLLSEDEQILLQRLSAFREGWFRHEAMAVCSAPPLTETKVESGLETLIDKSLVARRVLETGMTRFRLLEQVRQFAQDQSDSGLAEVLDRLIDYFVARSRASGESLLELGDASGSSTSVELLVEMVEDVSNLVLAFETALDTGRESDLFSMLANGAWQVFMLRSGHFHQLLGWLDRALETVTHQDPVLALAGMRAVGICAASFGEPHWLVDINERCRRRAVDLGWERMELSSMHGLALGLRRTGRFEESSAIYREVIDRAREDYPNLALEGELFLAMDFGVSEAAYQRTREVIRRGRDQQTDIVDLDAACLWAAWMAISTGHLEEGLADCERVLESPFWRLHTVMVCHLEDARARILAMLGRQAEAQEAVSRAREAGRRTVGPNSAAAWVYAGAATVAEYGGDAARAESLLLEGLETARRTGVPLHVGWISLLLVPPLLDRGDVGAAKRHLAQGEEALAGCNRLSDHRVLMACCRALIACAEGDVTGAAHEMIEASPEGYDDSAQVGDVRLWVEAAASVLASGGDARACDLILALEHWERRAGMVPNPVVERRRRAATNGLTPERPGPPPDLAEAVDIARSGLTSLAVGVEGSR